MKHSKSLFIVILIFLALNFIILIGCEKPSEQTSAVTKENPLKAYAKQKDDTYAYKLHKVIPGAGTTTHILRMVSGQWLTTNEVNDPEWWHWVRIVVPDSLASTIGMLYIGGGNRKPDEPGDADAIIKELALETGAIAIYLHNVPNQPVRFVGDNYGPRKEDELIAFAWRKYMEQGADKVEWLPRLPMTRAAVRAMDAASSYAGQTLGKQLDRFVVAGGSKRGWTTWTTAIADDRVIAIAPIVIDLLNIVPSFQHHWKAYGAWSAAVEDYVNEGIMDWMGSVEFQKLLDAVEPYSYRAQLTLPKMLINASGDEFFLSDSWQFYWDDLQGEKHVRYVPNTGHSLRKTDADQTLNAFFHSIVTNTPRPEFQWKVVNGTIEIQTEPNAQPAEIRLWQAVNENVRDFRVNVLGKKWTSELIPLSPDGTYQISVEAPPKGWKAFFVELTWPGPGKYPFKFTSGIVVVPDALPFPDYQAQEPQGTQAE